MINHFLVNTKVMHERLSPKRHHFEYDVKMFAINLSKVKTFPRFGFIFKFDEKYYLQTKKQEGESLDRTVRRLIREKYQEDLKGNIYLFTQVSIFGFCFNPVSFYYCFDLENTLQFIVAEITNTPWLEREVYILKCSHNSNKEIFEFKKNFHVSPFMPMSIDWKWHFSTPEILASGEKGTILMQDFDSATKELLFLARMSFTLQKLNPKNLLRCILSSPLLTIKPFILIYIHALILKLKQIPFYEHPNPEKRK